MGIDPRYHSPKDWDKLTEGPARELAEYFFNNKIDQYRVSDDVRNGKVIFGVDTHMNRPVVFKRIIVLNPKDFALAKRRRNEADVLKRLAHPNIVQLYNHLIDPPDLEDPSEPHVEYAVMEALDSYGELKNILEKATVDQSKRRQITGLSGEYISRLMWDVAAGLQRIHDEPLYHGDISIRNIVRSGSAWKIIDLEHSNHPELSANSTIGTDQYRPPEAKSSRNRKENGSSNHKINPDHRTDIFSVGAILYEMLTLKKLFDIDPDYPEELKRAAELPKPLDGIVETACRPDKNKRYSSIMSMNFDVQFALTDGFSALEEKIGRGENILTDLHSMVENMHRRFGGDAAATEKVTQCIDYLVSQHEDRERSKVGLGMRTYLQGIISELQKLIPSSIDPKLDGEFEKMFYDGKAPRRFANDANALLEILNKPGIPPGALREYLNKALEGKIAEIYGKTDGFMKKFCIDADNYNSPDGLKKVGEALLQNGILDPKVFKDRCSILRHILEVCPSRKFEGNKIVSTLKYISDPSTIIPIPTDMLVPARKAYFENRDFDEALKRARGIEIDYMRNATLAEIYSREALKLLDSPVELTDGKDGPVRVDVQPNRNVRFAEYVKKAAAHLSEIDDDKLHLWFVQAPWHLVKFITRNNELLEKCTHRFSQSEFKAWVQKIEQKSVPRLDLSLYHEGDKIAPLMVGKTVVYQPPIYQALLDAFTFQNGNYVYHQDKLDPKLKEVCERELHDRRNKDPLSLDLWAKSYVNVNGKYGGTQNIAIERLEKSLKQDSHNLRVRREVIQRCRAVEKAKDPAAFKRKIIEHCKEFLLRQKEDAEIREWLAEAYCSAGQTEGAIEEYKTLARGFIQVWQDHVPYKIPDEIRLRSVGTLGNLFIETGKLHEMKLFVQSGQVSQETLSKQKPWKSLTSLIEMERGKYEPAPTLLELFTTDVSLDSETKTINRCSVRLDEAGQCIKRMKSEYQGLANELLQYKLKEIAEQALKFNFTPSDESKMALVNAYFRRRSFSKLLSKMKSLKSEGSAPSTPQQYFTTLEAVADKLSEDSARRFGSDDQLSKKLYALRAKIKAKKESCTPPVTGPNIEEVARQPVPPLNLPISDLPGSQVKT